MSSTTESVYKKDGAKSDAQPEAKPDSKPSLSAGVGTTTTQPTEGQAAPPEQVNLTGRAVFAVETTAAGVVVRTAFLTEDNRLLDMPAVFPDMMYAMNVIDDLKRQVMQHFSQAAQVGAQVIANQMQQQQQQDTGRVTAAPPSAASASKDANRS